MVTAQDTKHQVDGGVDAASSALMMSKNPVAFSAGAGMLAGKGIENTLDVSKVAADHGTAIYSKLKASGVNDTTSHVLGGVATVTSIVAGPAIPIAAAGYVGEVAKWAYHSVF